ncbi:hypothetical protein NUACC21_75340 [Scytonema sp. NUACC21]
MEHTPLRAKYPKQRESYSSNVLPIHFYYDLRCDIMPDGRTKNHRKLPRAIAISPNFPHTLKAATEKQ